MKFSIFLSVMLVAGATLASSVESADTFGVLKITSTNTETVVSVPWEAAGGGAVKVKDFVKTTNMTAGDALYLYDASEQSYKEWVLGDSGWVGATTVKVAGITAAAGSDDILNRGDALIIWRQNYGSGDTPADSIYLYGKYNSTGVTSYPMAYNAGATKATLFAPVPVGSIGASIHVNDDTTTTGDKYLTWTNVKPQDRLAIQDADGNVVRLRWRADVNKWGVYDSDAAGYVYDFSIKPGMGAWYYAAAVSRVGAPTATLSTK